MVQGVEALRWNPAALSTLENKEVEGTHVEYYQGVTMENVAAAYPLDESGIAASLFYLSAGSLDGRDPLGAPTGDFPYYDLVGTLGYGRKILSRAEGADISVGAAVKVVQEAISETRFQNPALDLGATVSPMDKLNLGLTIRNLSTSKANFAREVVAGASYTFFQALTGGVGLNYSNDAPVR